ncbi:hypothetical protein EJ06DRAFT_526250 [Trichodelitschia bisporula]|uniref:Uncharacterized protein n=1 Tax=Trichodelitschia bisporula TaxID=703511 RepID=A0A6G1I7Y5_9PEZI|nr:hypothetical protein EJ06DRAFT_526250 [Trichodelitschia bisporula]
MHSHDPNFAAYATTPPSLTPTDNHSSARPTGARSKSEASGRGAKKLRCRVAQACPHSAQFNRSLRSRPPHK